MPVPSSADQIHEYRTKAADLRARAALVFPSDFREEMLNIARGYDDLANAVERRLLRR